MHLNIPLSSRGLKLPNSKPVCRVSALHFFVKSHQWLSDIKLIQISAFSSFLFQDQPLFHWWKANLGLRLSRNLRTPEDDDLHILSLCAQSMHDSQEFFKHFRLLFFYQLANEKGKNRLLLLSAHFSKRTGNSKKN
jgi:hypothetical protein